MENDKYEDLTTEELELRLVDLRENLKILETARDDLGQHIAEILVDELDR